MASGITTGISFAVGISLAGIALFLSWASTNYGFSIDLLKWLILPTLGYLVAIGLNIFLQQVSCGKSSITQIAIGNFLYLSTFASRYPQRVRSIHVTLYSHFQVLLS